MSQTLKLTPTESVTIRTSTDDVLEVEATYGPATKPPPRHLHPEQDERFEVLAGELRVRHGDQELTLGPGDVIEIPRGTAHQMWSPAGQARVRWETRPRGRTHEWFAAIDSLHAAGRVGSTGMPGPLAFATLLNEYDDVFRLAVGPDRLVRGALVPLAALGRTRGYG